MTVVGFTFWLGAFASTPDYAFAEIFSHYDNRGISDVPRGRGNRFGDKLEKHRIIISASKPSLRSPSGHAFISFASMDDTKRMTTLKTFSFGPDFRDGPLSGKLSEGDDVFMDFFKDQYQANRIALVVNDRQFEAAMKVADRWRGNDYYFVLQSDCTTFVEEVLAAIQAPVPSRSDNMLPISYIQAIDVSQQERMLKIYQLMMFALGQANQNMAKMKPLPPSQPAAPDIGAMFVDTILTNPHPVPESAPPVVPPMRMSEPPPQPNHSTGTIDKGANFGSSGGSDSGSVSASPPG